MSNSGDKVLSKAARGALLQLEKKENYFQKACIGAAEQAIVAMFITRKLVKNNVYKTTLEGLWKLYITIRKEGALGPGEGLKRYRTAQLNTFDLAKFEEDDAIIIMEELLKYLDNGSNAFDYYESNHKAKFMHENKEMLIKQYLVSNIPEQDRSGIPHWTLVVALKEQQIIPSILKLNNIDPMVSLCQSINAIETKDITHNNKENSTCNLSRTDVEKYLTECDKSNPDKFKQLLRLSKEKQALKTITEIRNTLKFFPNEYYSVGKNWYVLDTSNRPEVSENSVSFEISKETLHDSIKNRTLNKLLEELKDIIIGEKGRNDSAEVLYRNSNTINITRDDYIYERQQKALESIMVALSDYSLHWEDGVNITKRKDKLNGLMHGMICYDIYKQKEKGKKINLIDACKETQDYVKNLGIKPLSIESIKRLYIEVSKKIETNLAADIIDEHRKNNRYFSYEPWILPPLWKE